MGDIQEGTGFLDASWPGACGIADPEKRLYDAFGIRRGGMVEMFGPGAVACGLRATVKGHRIGRRNGDPWTLPAFVLVQGEQIVWRHDGSHAGDHPAWDDILEAVAP